MLYKSKDHHFHQSDCNGWCIVLDISKAMDIVMNVPPDVD